MCSKRASGGAGCVYWPESRTGEAAKTFSCPDCKMQARQPVDVSSTTYQFCTGVLKWYGSMRWIPTLQGIIQKGSPLVRLYRFLLQRRKTTCFRKSCKRTSRTSLLTLHTTSVPFSFSLWCEPAITHKQIQTYSFILPPTP